VLDDAAYKMRMKSVSGTARGNDQAE